MSSQPQMRRRRTSSLGKVDIGDTTGSSLQTMSSSERSEKLKLRRLSKLEEKVEGDLSLLNKLWLSIVELNYRYTWLTPALIMVCFYTAYFLSGNYTETNILHAFITLSYEIPGTEPKMYGKGPKDFLFVAFHMVAFTFFREFLMQICLRPIADRTNLKESKKKRLMEQNFSMVYYGITSPLGLYIMKQTPMWFFNTTLFYENYPHRSHEYLFKWYYLVQLSFWAQQSVLLLLQVEKPRKDFKELVFHHIVTIALIFLSYRFHFTWMGLAVYITMDVSDFFLAWSKSLNYVDSKWIPLVLGSFFFTWIYTRHYLNIKILYSVLTEFKTVGRYDLDWVEQNYKCWISQPIVFVLIFALQVLNAFWLFLLIRIIYRYLFLDIAKDDRSDSETEEEEPQDEKK